MLSDVKHYSVFKLAWPIFLQMLLSMCLGYADTVMISHYSDTAVGALGNANQVLGFLTLAFSIISSATGVVVAQFLGADQHDKMDRIYTVSVFFNLVLSIFICAAVTIFSRSLLSFMHIPSVMMEDADKYMKIVGCFLFTDAAVQVFSQIFNCNGKTSIGMIIFFCMNIINIAGNYVFLYGPLSYLNLGVVGVAITTSTSSVIGFIAAFICFKKIIGGRISLQFFKPFPKDILVKLIRLGLPAAGENISYNISQIFITLFVNMLGPVEVTAKIYCNILCNFSIVYSNAVAGATSIITGHSVGSNDYDFAYRRVLKSLASAMFVSMLIASANWLLSPYTLRLFTADTAIIALGRKVMFVSLCLEIGRTSNLVIIRSMRAAGDVFFPTALGIGSMWGISVVFAWILGIHFNLGLPGIWAAMAADEIFRGVVVFIRWQTGKWRGRNVVRTAA